MSEYQEHCNGNRAIEGKAARGTNSYLLCATLHHLCEQRDAVEVDELLSKGDVS